MAVTQNGSPDDSPPSPHQSGVGLGIRFETNETDETDETQQAQLATEKEKGERKSRRPKWLCWSFPKKTPKDGRKMKVSKPAAISIPVVLCKPGECRTPSRAQPVARGGGQEGSSALGWPLSGVSIFTDGSHLEHTQDTGLKPQRDSAAQNLSPRSIMGRIGRLFKKSDDKEKPPSPSPSNPYAQQQPPADPYSSPPPDYNQYNQNQYNGNQYISQQAQGPPSGLPSGPRPGGLPSKVAPGPPRTGTWESNKTAQTAPPRYSEQSGGSPGPPSYANGSPSLASAGNSPALSSSAASPSMNSGYPREKYGAPDGVGRNRFEPPAPSPYGRPAGSPSQQQGGYGNLDTGSGGLFDNYNGPQRQALGSDSPQFGAPGAAEQTQVDMSNMTEEEREDAEYNAINGEIKQTRNETEYSLDRSLARAREMRERNAMVMDTLGRQGDMLRHANSHMVESEVQGQRSNLNVKDLNDATGSMFKTFTARSRREKLDEEKLRQELGARQMREEAKEIKRVGGSQAQRKLLPKGQQTLGARSDPAHRKKFVLEEDDEEQEERLDGKLGELSELMRGVNMDAEQIGEVINEQNVLINSMNTRKPRPETSEPAPDQDAADHDAANPGPSRGSGDATSSATSSPSRPLTGDPQYFATRKALPLWTRQDDIRQILRQKDVLVIVGETGSGKSTQVPQYLYQEKWCQRRKVKIKAGEDTQEIAVGGMIAITQPRRVAATTLAHRVSREAGTPLNTSNGPFSKGLVGYSVRFDHRVPPGTRIKYLTEGMLLQELLRDPHLRQYSAIIVDEIHERSVDVDLLSGFLKQIVSGDKAGRGGIPLKVVVMSATANVENIKRFFSSAESEDSGPAPESKTAVEFLQIEGRQFPVDIIHTPRPVPDIQDTLLKTIFKIHTEEALSDKHGTKDILAFLTGQEEIESAQRLVEEYSSTLGPKLPKIKVFPLFGQLSMETQHAAFQPIKGGFTRKIVLATNIAETSVTVPGVRYVIDCGKSKVKQFRPRLGMESLLAKPISKSSAIQRAGRAGREGPGKCFRLYTEETYETLEKTDLPELLRTDILSAILTMKARGIDDVLSFPFMDPPEVESVEKALFHLHVLGAIADDGAITETGRKMVSFPLAPPYARVVVAAAEPNYDCLLEAIDIISCITAGENIFMQLRSEEAQEEAEEYRKELSRREGDLLTYLTTMQRYTAENADRTQWCKDRKLHIRNMKQALNIRKQLRGLCVRQGMMEQPPPDPQPFTQTSPEQAAVILKCFLNGFVLKTAILMPDASYVTSQGKHVVAIHPSSVMHGQKKEAIMFLEHVYTQKNYAKKVSAIQAVWIAEALEK
ncbi:P-loop containing nucleoside triphosphate hydrolase protein [Chaetomidium leptoderma]|uniref:RNA helicase n=1 Tax=Chaetomidium leptoderma TaxID=669021 RepID=A0AAN6VGN9_9PEZI|nr:P-loop containing nucleoside triphosphate hydrolase protein [Chaetomidium leptoderma]